MTSTDAPAGGIFDTTTERFAADVVERSRSVVVAVDFWAPWCAPCRALAPLLAELVSAYAGRLCVARVNTDEEPALAAQFGIRSIPDVRIFRDGRQVDGFVGAQPLQRLQPLFDKHVPHVSEGKRAQAQARIQAGDAAGAIALLRELVAADSRNTTASVDLANALARDGDAAEAERILTTLPPDVSASKEADAVRARIHFLRSSITADEAEELRRRLPAESADLEALHRLASYELLQGDATQGLEHLLTIMRRDRAFQDGLGRRSLRHAFQLLGESDERVAQYRRKMAALLY